MNHGIQQMRNRTMGRKINWNAQPDAGALNKTCAMTTDARSLIKMSGNKLELSNRAYTRTLKEAHTIADLDGSDIIDMPHVAEAVQYRAANRKYWR